MRASRRVIWLTMPAGSPLKSNRKNPNQSAGSAAGIKSKTNQIAYCIRTLVRPHPSNLGMRSRPNFLNLINHITPHT
jgi:hypothetical protein